MTTPARKDWLYFIHAGGRVYLNDLELVGLTHYDMQQYGNDPVRLTLELFIQPPQDPPDEIKLAIAAKLLEKK